MAYIDESQIISSEIYETSKCKYLSIGNRYFTFIQKVPQNDLKLKAKIGIRKKKPTKKTVSASGFRFQISQFLLSTRM